MIRSNVQLQHVLHEDRFCPQESVRKFVFELKEQGVFAKEVRSAGVAFHSYYMASIAPTLLEALKKVLLAQGAPLL